jgi:hypothetical protein
MASRSSNSESLENARSSAASENETNDADAGPRLAPYAQCIRQVAATAPYKKMYMFNEPAFDEAALRKDGAAMSSKFQTLLSTITALDAEDQKTHGTLFKHFIFTDLRKAAYGAKAIASFLAAHGFECILKAEKGYRRRKIVGADKKPVLDEKGTPTYRVEEVKKLKVTLAGLASEEGGSNRVGLLQSSPLWKSQLGVDVRKKMLSVFNSRPDNIHGEKIRIMVLDSKFKEGIDLYDVKYVHLMEPQITEADLKQAVGRATRFCGQRGLKFVPGVGWPLEVFLYEAQFDGGFPFSDATDGGLFDAHKHMLERSGLDLGLLKMTRDLTVLAIKSAVDYDLTYKINNFKMESQLMAAAAGGAAGATVQQGGARSAGASPLSPGSAATPLSPLSVRALPNTDYQDIFPKPVPLKAAGDSAMAVGDFFAAQEAAAEFEDAAHRLDFGAFQQFVRERYAAYGWESPVVKNGCEVAPVPGKAVTFSKSQDFVRHYLTPGSPYRGLLAWHSVGTGKTCTAVAAATTEFEKQGYSILWVTRNSLMADVWKNMFGAVCSISVQEQLAAGKKLPRTLGGQKRMVSKLWFDPISYKTFENALVPVKKGARKGAVNKLGMILRERNGVADPLARTFVIIDEVHKLLDGDLKKSEMADFERLAAAIQHSYAVSGRNSVRVLLMTATPITDNPEGLFKLLNVLIPDSARRFPSLAEFREDYTDEEGTITQAGVNFFQGRAKGLISYLNREFDPSTFAQPHFNLVPVPVSGAIVEGDDALVQACVDAEVEDEEEEEEIECDVEEIQESLAEALAEAEEEGLSKKELAARKRTLKAEYKARVADCKKRIKTRKQKIKDKEKRIAACLSEKSKARRRSYTASQQKAAKRCLGKEAKGVPVKFSTIAALKALAKTRKRGSAKAAVTASGTPLSSAGAVVVSSEE